MTFYYAAWSLALQGSETYTHFTRKLSCKTARGYNRGCSKA